MKFLLTKGIQLASVAVILTTFVACSGSSGNGKKNNNGNPSSQEQSGQFADALVAGLRFESGGLADVSDDQGEFKCMSGQMVSFFLDTDGSKDILLGQVQCRAVVSPIELVTKGAQNITTPLNSLSVDNRQKVVNMLRLIQSLDVDLNVSNDIYLEATVMTDVADYAVFRSGSEEDAKTFIQDIIAMDEDDFSNELDLLLAAIGRSGKAVTEAAAVAHFESYRQNCTVDGCNAPPVVIPENRYACIAGYSLMAESNIYASIIDTMNGQIRAEFTGQDEPASTLVVIYEDQDAKIYRRENAGYILPSQTIFSGGARYALFDAEWSYDAQAEVVTVSNIQFQNATETYSFSGVENLGVTTLVLADISSGAQTQSDQDEKDALTYWAVKHNCSLPPSNDVNNLGDGSN